ncbi:MAG: hypothetical protein AAFR81_17430 [Chloroflexota bacterium]
MTNQDKPKRKRQPNQQSSVLRFMLKGLLALLSMAVVFIGCGMITLWWIWSDNSICFGAQFPNESHFARQAQLTLPYSAQNIDNGIINVQSDSCSTWLTFEMSSDEFETFANTTVIDNFEEQMLSGSTIDYFLAEANWEQPANSIAGYADTYGRYGGYMRQWIFIDTSDTDSWIVYVITSENWL